MSPLNPVRSTLLIENAIFGLELNAPRDNKAAECVLTIYLGLSVGVHVSSISL